MRCTKEFTLTVEGGGDMPLDQAIYVASLDKIFGCRGPFVYRFNADTGAKELDAKVKPIWGSSCLAWDSTRNVLFWAGQYDLGFRYVTVALSTKTNICVPQKLDSDLTLVGQISNSCNQDTDFGGEIGFRHMLYDPVHDSMLYGYSLDSNGSYGPSEFAQFDPTAASVDFTSAAGNISSNTVRDLTYDSVNSWYWIMAPWGYMDIAYYDSGAWQYYDEISWNAAQPNLEGTGLAIDPVTGKVWAATGTRYVLEFTYTGVNPTPTVHDLGTDDAQPQKIRYNTNNNFLYLPSMNDNKVYVVDPGTGAVASTFTGFDCPFDVVFTGSKSFAVQRGKQPLKEVV